MNPTVKFVVLLAFALVLFMLVISMLGTDVTVLTNLPLAAGILGFSFAGGMALIAAGMIGARKE